MKNLKNTLLYVAFLIIPTLGIAQQMPQFSQYMYNTISINPAYAGSREVLVVNLLNRNQWVGIEGAPVTQTLSTHSSIPNSKLGVGLSVINDKLAYEQTTYVFTDVSYTINLNRDFRLAFGLKVGANKLSLDEDLMTDPMAGSDPFLDRINYDWTPNIGAGLYLRNDKWYVGLSSPKIIDHNNRSNLEYVSIDRVSYYLNGGYVYSANKSNLKFKPTFLLKYTNGAPMSVDLTFNVLIQEKFWLGAAYRLNDSFGGMANFQVTEGISIGYAYDYITSDLGNFTSGSHEVVLNFEFNFPEPSCDCTNLYN